MSFQHDQMSHVATKQMLQEVQTGIADWLFGGRLSERTTYWQGVIDWPQPDNAFQDSSTGASLAIEFKPPGHGKSEYVRGLGQALTYLQSFEFSALVVPRLAQDGYAIADYLKAVLEKPGADRLSVGLFAYEQDAAQLTTLVGLRERQGEGPPLPTGVRKVFWAYWRDLSQNDLLTLLIIMDRNGCDFDQAYQIYWNENRRHGTALDWEGNARKIPAAGKSNASELANDFLSFRHIGLIDSQKHLTDEGYRLLRDGKVYGSTSQYFLTRLGQQVLLRGRHLELIFWVEETQRVLPAERKSDHETFRRSLDQQLQNAGIIEKLPNNTGKGTFIRDEGKLWNKLGLLRPRTATSYFFDGEGYRFDWRRIVSTANYV